jgi:glyoxylase-like metal-dependent hydrolase (beta-lactamase superfamily II)
MRFLLTTRLVMIEISQHGAVTRFRLGRQVMGKVHYWTSCFWLDGILIDTGCAHTAEELLAELRPRGVEIIVNTHYHEDHIGGNALISRELNAPIFAPKASLAHLAQPPWIHQHRELVWGTPEPSQGQALGDTLAACGHVFQVHPAPGHCPDQEMLFEQSRGWLFCGDAFIAENPRTARPEENYNQCLETQQAMAALKPEVMFCSPLGAVEPALPALNHTIDYLQHMQARIQEMSGQGINPEQIVQELFGRESKLVVFTEGQFSYQNFVEAFLK